MKAKAKQVSKNMKTDFHPSWSLSNPTMYCPTAAPTAPVPSMMPVTVAVARAP